MSAELVRDSLDTTIFSGIDKLVHRAEDASNSGEPEISRTYYLEAASIEVAIFETLNPNESRKTKNDRSDAGVRAVSLYIDANLNDDAIIMATRIVEDPNVYMRSKLLACGLVREIDPELGKEMGERLLGGVTRIAEKMVERGWLPKEKPQEVIYP